MRPRFLLLTMILLLGLGPPSSAPAQEEVTADVARYSQYEVSGMRTDRFEVSPLPVLRFADDAVPRTGPVGYRPEPDAVRPLTRLADAHLTLDFYEFKRCADCHQGYDRDYHSTRGVITCRQCHGHEPIAAAAHYYSPLNPIRKHAYVCAQCHQGAGASFATYVVHEPPPGSAAAARTMPVLYWVFWIMVGITLVTFVLFLPHTLLWVGRELFGRRNHDDRGGEP